MKEFIDRLVESLPSWLLNDLADSDGNNVGGGFVGAVFGLPGQIVCGVALLANRGALLKDQLLCEDLLPLAAWERLMPSYVGETTAQHAYRLAHCWDAYTYPGRPAIIEQLGYYGFGDNVAIYDAYDWPAEPPVGPLSQFWVVVPQGDHTFSAAIWGQVTWGQFRWGIVGATRAQTAGIKALVRKWKPVQWVCRQVRFSDGGTHYAVIPVNLVA